MSRYSFFSTKSSIQDNWLLGRFDEVDDDNDFLSIVWMAYQENWQIVSSYIITV